MSCSRVLSGAVLGVADYWELFVAIGSGFSMVVERRINICSKVLSSTLVDVMLKCWYLVIPEFHFKASVVLLLLRLKWPRGSTYFLVPLLAVVTLRAAFWPPPTVHFVVPGAGTTWQWFAIIVKRWYCIDGLFWRIRDTVPLLSRYGMPFRARKSGSIHYQRIWGWNLFNNPLAAASLSNNLEIWALTASLITSLRSRYSITC